MPAATDVVPDASVELVPYSNDGVTATSPVVKFAVSCAPVLVIEPDAALPTSLRVSKDRIDPFATVPELGVPTTLK